MRESVKILLTWLSLIGYLVFAFITTGLLTNWFRYGASIEALAVLGPLVFFSMLIVFLHLKSIFSTKQRTIVTSLAFASEVASILIVFLLMHSVYGYYYPSWYKDDAIQNAPQSLVIKNGQITYYLEVHNPFSDDHEEYLILILKNSMHRLKLPIFEWRRQSLTYANNASDWCTLVPTQDSGIYLLHITSELRESTFEINLFNLGAREIAEKQIK